MELKMNHSLKIVNWISKNLTILVITSLILGAIKGYFFPMEFDKTICGVAMLFMIFPLMVNLKVEHAFKNLNKYYRPLLISFIINFIISPVIAILIVMIFLKGNVYYAIGLLLIGSIPTSGLTLNWIHRFKGDMHMGIMLVTFNIFLAFILVPFFIPLLTNTILDSNIEIDSWLIIEKVLFIVVVPLILGYLTRFVFKKMNKTLFLENHKQVISGISNIGLLVVMFLLMSLESSQIVLANLFQSLIVIPSVILYYLIMFLLYNFFIKKFIQQEETITLFLTTFLRYHIISLGIALSAFGETSNGIFVIVPVILGILIQPTAVSLLGKYVFHKADSSQRQEISLKRA